jgi:hypothetical protein
MRKTMAAGRVIMLSGLVLIAGCSVYMESNRPTPVKLAEYESGQSRESVIGRLGAPASSTQYPGGNSCDLYQLYTKGYGTGGKVATAVVESAADVFTLGLAEVVLTPTEAVTKNELHPVKFCYHDQKLTMVSDNPDAPIPSDSAVSPQAVAGANPQPATAVSATATPSPAPATPSPQGTNTPPQTEF